MTPPRQPPADAHPRPIQRADNPTPQPRPIPIRPLTLDGLAEKVDHTDRKVDRISADLTDHEVAEKDSRELVGRIYVDLRELRHAVHDQAGQIGSLAGTAMTTKGEVARLASTCQRNETTMREIRSILGEPPRDPQMVARESHRDMTREEIEALEAGSGLLGDNAKQSIHIAQLWRRVKLFGGAVAVASVVSPHVPAILNAIFGG